MRPTWDQKIESSLNQYLDCFGRYRKNDPICRNRCGLNIRCAIEQDQNERFEILEDLVSTGGMFIRVN